MSANRFQELRQDRYALESALTALGSTVKGSMCTCPYHDDTNPSASIHDDGGVWRVRCFVCDESWDVLDLQAKAKGCDSAELMRELNRTEPRQEVVQSTRQPPREQVRQSWDSVQSARDAYGRSVQSVYEYTNPETGIPDLVIFRLQGDGQKKKFIQAHFENGRLFATAPEKPYPIYRRKECLAAEIVIVVEGEKCADELLAIGIAATTSPGGAGKAEHAKWNTLAGKTVYLWPDNDPIDSKTGKSKGVEHMRDVARILEGIYPAPSLYWIDPAELGLPDKGDVADLLEELQSQSQEQCRTIIYEILNNAEPLGPSRELGKRIESIIAGEHIAAPMPWSMIAELTKMLLPGTISLMCGPGGATKSFFILQCLAFWNEHKMPAAVYELEDDRSYHLHRAMCQMSNNSNLFDDEWVRENPVDARNALVKCKGAIDVMGRSLWEAPNGQVSLDELTKWVDERCEQGARIIVIDPITAASTEDKPWVADLKFMMGVKKTLRDHGASLVILTHPKKGTPGKGKGSMDDLAGGAAYQRFAHTVIFLEPCDSDEIDVMFQDGPQVVTGRRIVNRILRIYKARNGRGSGTNIGMFFNGGTLRFKCQGVIPGKGGSATLPKVRHRKRDDLQPGSNDKPPRAHRMAAPPSADPEPPF